MRVVLSLRRGRLAQRKFERVTGFASPRSGDVEPWAVLVQRNADVMAMLDAAGVVGPLGWHD